MTYKTAYWTVIKLVIFAAMLNLFCPLYGYTGPIPDGGNSGVVKNLSINKSEKFDLVDKGDYYYLNTGEKVSFLRRKNTYLTIFHKKKTKASPLQKLVMTKFEDKLNIIKGRFPDKYIMFQVKEDKNSVEVVRELFYTDTSIKFISPVLTNAAGDDNLALTPSIIVSIMEDEDKKNIIEKLEQIYNLSLVSRLSFSDSEYEFNINQEISDIGRIFDITRQIADTSYIEWVEPNFLVTPQKQQFIPNDTLFNNQWHLNNNRDADIDAPEGWDISKGNNSIIAVIDDGVDILHPDLSIWSNPGETGLDGSGNDKRTNGIDDDGNGYIDDHQGWDFDDGDNNPAPLAGDNHGTAVSGVAGAIGNNNSGVTGSAMHAAILSIRAEGGCVNLANAIRYAGKYADVVNNSWSIGACQSNLNAAIADVVNGNIAGARRGANGSPVLFASGNGAGGWKKYTVPMSVGMHTLRWSFIKDAAGSDGHDTVWLDDIDWGFFGTTDFNEENTGVIPAGFTSSGNADWVIVNDSVHARGVAGNSVRAGSISDNQQTNLEATRAIGSEGLTFWVWVSCQAPTAPPSPVIRDRFEFFVDGIRQYQFAPGQYGSHIETVAYPASNPDTIAVGASTDGVWSGKEERSYYSQFGSSLDVLAPSSGGEERITTTDRLGGVGYNPGIDNDLADIDYTETFGGTSSATPLVSGVVASLISFRNSVTASEIRTILHNGTDKIGPYAYVSGRNDYYGYGRINFPMIVGQTWVDFYHSGQEAGSPDKAFNTLSEGINSVPAGGLMIIRTGTTDEAAVITKKMTIKAVGGTVTIGE